MSFREGEPEKPRHMRWAQVRFHAMAVGPEAVGRDQNGKTVFAPFCAPDERATVEICEEKSGFARGYALEIHEENPHRIAPPCPYFRPQTPQNSCGGCHLQHMTTDFGRETKRQSVEFLLRRALKDPDLRVEMALDSPSWNYRNKAEFRIEKNENHAVDIGFYAHASHRLVPIENCLIQAPQNLEVLRVARENRAALSRAKVTRVLARVSSRGEGFVMLEFAQKNQHWRDCAEIFRENLPHLVGIGARKSGAQRGEVQRETLWGRAVLMEEVDDLTFRVAGDGFWQVNARTTPQMVRCALEFLGLERDELALDLYCGSGLFAVAMARAGAIVTGIEASETAIQNARFNARENGVSAQFFAGDCARLLRRQSAKFNAILLDPPRAGAKGAIADLLRLGPLRIVYVSCDPATLARDLALLAPKYRVTHTRCFDVFAQTSHIETIVRLEKSVLTAHF